MMNWFNDWRRSVKAAAWKRAGRVPGGAGHGAARWVAIENAVSGATAGRFGWDDAGIDERVVEYAWAFERIGALKSKDARVLDAGSVLNYPAVLRAWRRAANPAVSIVTLKYEGFADPSDDVRYEFADLRRLPYRDEWFSHTLSLSTLEHVGLDNTIYGASAESAPDANAEVVRALTEIHRVTARGGTLLVSVPYGARSNRGWFRILDGSDLARMTTAPGWSNPKTRYFRCQREGWRECSADDAKTAGYNEPLNRPGQQTAPAWVSGAEAVALIELTRA
jgi:SAM-dependent methyltransferase